jgi:hypothetical protein
MLMVEYTIRANTAAAKRIAIKTGFFTGAYPCVAVGSVKNAPMCLNFK